MDGEYEKIIRSDPQGGYFAGVLHVYAGMIVEGLDLLEQAVKNGFYNYPLMSEKDPILEPIRKFDRFKKLMKKYNRNKLRSFILLLVLLPE